MDGLKGLLGSKGGAGQKASQQPQFVSFSPAILGQWFHRYNLEVFANQGGETTALRAADSPQIPGQDDLQKPLEQILFKGLVVHEPGPWTTDLMLPYPNHPPRKSQHGRGTRPTVGYRHWSHHE